MLSACFSQGSNLVWSTGVDCSMDAHLHAHPIYDSDGQISGVRVKDFTVGGNDMKGTVFNLIANCSESVAADFNTFLMEAGGPHKSERFAAVLFVEQYKPTGEWAISKGTEHSTMASWDEAVCELLARFRQG